jgi:hypothetical protein
MVNHRSKTATSGVQLAQNKTPIREQAAKSQALIMGTIIGY